MIKMVKMVTMVTNFDGNPRNHLPRDTAMALMDHLKSLDSERQKAQRYARELHLDLVSAMILMCIVGLGQSSAHQNQDHSTLFLKL